MSIDRTSYLLYGFKVTDKNQIEVFDDHYEDLLEEKPYSNMFNNTKSEQTIVYDYMCGEYIYIGLRLASVDEDDETPVELSESDLHNLNEKLNNCMSNWPDYLVDMFKNIEPKLYLFIHVY